MQLLYGPQESNAPPRYSIDPVRLALAKRPSHPHTKTNNLTYYYYHHHPKRELGKRNGNIEKRRGNKILFGRLITFQTTSTRS